MNRPMLEVIPEAMRWGSYFFLSALLLFSLLFWTLGQRSAILRSLRFGITHRDRD